MLKLIKFLLKKKPHEIHETDIYSFFKKVNLYDIRYKKYTFYKDEETNYLYTISNINTESRYYYVNNLSQYNIEFAIRISKQSLVIVSREQESSYYEEEEAKLLYNQSLIDKMK